MFAAKIPGDFIHGTWRTDTSAQELFVRMDSRVTTKTFEIDGLPNFLRSGIWGSARAPWPCKTIWENETFRVEWEEGYLVKKGNLAGCSNDSGITMLFVPGKILNRIILQ